MQVRAFVDESFRPGPDGKGIYLFAAVTIASRHEDEVRDRLQRALPGRMRRFHWRVDRDDVRERALAVMRAVDIEGLIIYRIGVPRKRTEKARQHAMWNLIERLRDQHVHDVVFEARERGQDMIDKQTLHSISRARVSSERFRYSFGRPLDEPLLWLPDYLAGAWGEALRNGSRSLRRYSLPVRLVVPHELPPLPR